jgi:hypothetical protein
MNTEFTGNNIGCVVYNKDFQNGKMTANWHFRLDNILMKGTGKATGEPGEKYSGKYFITYYNSRGIEAGSYDLIINEQNDLYFLQWFQDKSLKYSGIGMLSGNSLIAGWKKELSS